MTKFAIRLLTLAMYSMALVAVPLITSAHAAGGDNPSPPATDTSKDKEEEPTRAPASTIPNSSRAIARPTPRSTTATITPPPSSN